MKKRLFRGGFVCFLFILFSTAALAGEKYQFINYTIDHGLPSSQVYNTVQDPHGNLWFATDQGLSRYNGYAFRNYSMQDGLPGNTVLQLFPQSNGNIWGATLNNRLFHIRASDQQIIAYPYNHLLDNYQVDLVINSLYVDEENTVYIGVLGMDGLIIIDDNGQMIDFLSEHPGSSYLVNAVQAGRDRVATTFTFSSQLNPLINEKLQNFKLSMVPREDYGIARSEFKDGLVVFCTGEGIVFQGKETEWKASTATSPTSVGHLSNEKVWVGLLNRGVQVYDHTGRLVDEFLDGKSVTDVFVDHEQGIWITTLYSGVFYLKNMLFTVKKLLPTHELVSSITHVPQEGVYLGCDNGGVIHYQNGKAVVKTASHTGRMSMVAYNPYFNGAIELVDFSKLVMKKGQFNLSDSCNELGSRMALSNDYNSPELLIGCMKGFMRITTNGNWDCIKTDLRIYDMQHAKGGLYCATMKGLYHYSTQGVFSSMRHRDTVFSARTVDLNANAHFYFMATRGNGLVVFNNDTVFTLDKAHGLNSNFITRLHVQNDSVLWVGTNAGLNRLVFSTSGRVDVAVVSTKDGLVSNEVKDICVIDDSVWVATGKGLCVFPLNVLEKSPPPIHHFLRLKGIVVNETRYDTTSLASLSADENRLTFHFEAISFKKSAELVYRYRLEGLEDNWNTTTNRMAIYPALPPGKYRFIIQVSGTGKHWEENQCTFAISIAPPFYSSWWFRLLATVAVLFIVYLFFKIRILTYNRDISRELLRYLLKRVKRKEKYLVLKEQGKYTRIASQDIHYIKSAGNYIEVVTKGNVYKFRGKIGEVKQQLPDPIEFLRVHRSYIIRLDKVERHNRKTVVVMGIEIPIGGRYQSDFLEAAL